MVNAEPKARTQSRSNAGVIAAGCFLMGLVLVIAFGPQTLPVASRKVSAILRKIGGTEGYVEVKTNSLEIINVSKSDWAGGVVGINGLYFARLGPLSAGQKESIHFSKFENSGRVFNATNEIVEKVRIWPKDRAVINWFPNP